MTDDDGYLAKILKKSSPDTSDNTKTEITEKQENREETQTSLTEQSVEPTQEPMVIEAPEEEIENKPFSVIDEFSKKITNAYDIPPIFVETAGYAILSSTIGMHYRQLPEVVGAHTVNPWFIISGISRGTHRSTLNNFYQHVYRNVHKDFLKRRINPNAQQEEITNTLKLIEDDVVDSVIESGSVEGIIDHCEKHQERKQFDIQSSEFGPILKSGGSGYTKGILSVFSKLKGGEGGRYYFSTRTGKEACRTLPEGLFVTMFCGMQEAWDYIETPMIRQGLLCRVLLVYSKPISGTDPNYRDAIDPLRPDVYEKLKPVITELVRRKKDLSREVKYVTWEPDAYKPINEIARETRTNVCNDTSNINIYKQGYQDHLIALATLRAIDNESYDKDGNIIVKKEHTTRALDYLNRATSNHLWMLSQIGKTSARTETAEQPLELVYSKILARGSTGISTTDLYNETKMKQSILMEYIATLIQAERIVHYIVKTDGRDRTMYRASIFSPVT